MRYIFLRTIFIVSLFAIGGLIILSFIYLTEDNPGINNIRVTNLTSNSVTISWETNSQSKGRVVWSEENNLGFINKSLNKLNTAWDERDTELNKQGEYAYSENDSKRNFHFVTIRNLKPQTEYFIGIDGNMKLFDKISITTLQELDIVSNPDPIYGDVRNYMTSEPEPKEGILFYQLISFDGKSKSLEYSSLINPNSSWSGDLSNMRDEKGKVIKWDKESYKISLEAFTDIGEGISVFRLDEYKPIENLFVNVRYVPNL